MNYILILTTVAYVVVTMYVTFGADHTSLVGRWLALLDVPAQWVAEFWPPILWPVSWPIFAVGYALTPLLALFSSRLFVPQRFR